METQVLKDAAEILIKAGYTLQDCQTGFICLTDPTCIWPPLLEFIKNAWLILSVVTGILLIGWAVTLVRGASHDMVKNIRTLVLIFGSLSAWLPAVNFLGGGKYVVAQCDTIKISQSDISKLLQMREQKLEKPTYESIEIWDSAIDGSDDDTETDIEDEFNF